MTLRLDMRKAVSRAGGLPTESRQAVVAFLLGQLNPDGGFRGRSTSSDVYYTAFGLEALLALDAQIPIGRIADYLDRFADGDELDFIHLCCLIRSLANIADSRKQTISWQQRRATTVHLEEYRTADGAFATSADASDGSIYACFFALGAYQDLGVAMPDIDRVVDHVLALQTEDGGFANEPAVPLSATPATAAAITVLHYLQQPIPEAALDWLLKRLHRQGGFTPIAAQADAGFPDLLSTATAIHALSLARISTDPIRERCLEFLDSLWQPDGGFQGSWADEIVDCEYTYYGLLTLGHLT